MTENKIFKMDISFGRMGDIDGLFIATEEEVNKLIGQEICFGSILGKHSQILCDIETDYITRIDVSQDVISALIEKMGYTLCGYNPFDYINNDDEEAD